MTDSYQQLQNSINSAVTGSVLNLSPNTTYNISQALLINKPLTLNLNNSTINLLDGISYPNNSNIIIRSSTRILTSWTSNISAGDYVLQIPMSTVSSTDLSVFTPGTDVWLELGHDSIDSNFEPHWSGFVKIVSVNGNNVTINQPIPYDINNSNIKSTNGIQFHTISKINSFAQNIKITNGKLTNNSKLNYSNIWAEISRNVTIDNLIITGNGLIIDHIENIVIENINMYNKLTTDQFIGGRKIHNALIKNCNHYTVDKQSQSFFFEGQCNNVHIDNVKVLTPGSSPNLANVSSESRIVFENIRIEAKDNISVGNSTLDSSSYFKIRNIELCGIINYIDLSIIDNLIINGDIFSSSRFIEKTYSSEELLNNTIHELPDCLIKSLRIRLNGIIYSGNILIDNESGSNIDLTPYLINEDPYSIAGEWVKITQCGCLGNQLGSNNINGYLPKRLIGNLILSNNSTIDVIIEIMEIF